MKLTDEQLKVLDYSENCFIEACPGSGKTTTLLFKLQLLSEGLKESTRKVACITYTNSAVYEIEDRISKSGSSWINQICNVTTIHTFCLNEILRHYYWRAREYKKGFCVLPPESDEFKSIVGNVVQNYSLSAAAIDKFENLNFDLLGNPITPNEIPKQAALDFWAKLSKAGYIDFPSIVFQSYKLLENYPGIARSLSSKFAWMLIDEFQDTSEIQVAILKKIFEIGRTKFVLVGDPFQSIFGFAGGNPALIKKFANQIGAQNFPLSNNFRSSAHIVSQAETVLPRIPKMIASGSNSAFPITPRKIVVGNFSDGIEDHFLTTIQALKIPFEESAILAPTWFSLFPIARRLRGLGIPIIGPGARPYRKNHLFSPLAEQVCAYMTSPTPRRMHKLKKELFVILSSLSMNSHQNVHQFDGTILAMKLVRKGMKLSELHEGALDWLESAAIEFEKIMVADGWIDSVLTGTLLTSAKRMQTEIKNEVKDFANLTTHDLGIFGVPEKCMKLTTMHKSKGHEFDAVALIDLHDHIIPNRRHHNYPTQLEETQRLFYVAMTRPRKLLLYFSRENVAPSRYLSNIP